VLRLLLTLVVVVLTVNCKVAVTMKHTRDSHSEAGSWPSQGPTVILTVIVLIVRLQ
jgi:hypothetical protein